MPVSSQTILLVDDDTSVRELIRRFLEVAGYSVLEATGPAQAQTINREHPGHIDLLITDITMPETSGVELAAELSESRPGMKVLYVSGYAAESESIQPDRVAHASFLQKPFSAASLKEKVAALLDGDATAD